MTAYERRTSVASHPVSSPRTDRVRRTVSVNTTRKEQIENDTFHT